VARAVTTPTFTATEQAFATNVNPLSGLPSDSRGVADRRPRAIAVSSWESGALPAGLQASEIVVEARLPGAGGLTAVSAEPPEDRPEIGPVRSAEWSDLAVAQAFGATLVAADASDAIADALRSSGLPSVLMLGGSGDPQTASLSPDYAFSPGWQYTDQSLDGGTQLAEVALPQVQATPLDPAGGLDSSADAPEDELSAPRGVTWRYDPVLGLWRRLRGGAPEIDAASGEGVVAANLVLLAVEGEPVGSNWWVGSGPAAVLRDGGMVKAQWARGGPSEQLRLIGESDGDAELRTGNTWLILVAGEVLDQVLQSGTDVRP
jgi:hypothetical protein